MKSVTRVPRILAPGLLVLLAACTTGKLSAVTAPAPMSFAHAAVSAAAVLANNAGALTGVLRGPSDTLVANNASTVLAGAGVLANHGGDLRILALDDLTAPLSGVAVAAVDLAGHLLSDEHPVTDNSGRYLFSHLLPSGPLVYLRAAFSVDGHGYSIEAVTPAPRAAATLEVPMDPATTLVAKKIGALEAAGAAPAASLTGDTLKHLATDIGATLGPTSVVAALVLPPPAAAKAFDRLVNSTSAVKANLARDLGERDLDTAWTQTPDLPASRHDGNATAAANADLPAWATGGNWDPGAPPPGAANEQAHGKGVADPGASGAADHSDTGAVHAQAGNNANRGAADGTATGPAAADVSPTGAPAPGKSSTSPGNGNAGGQDKSPSDNGNAGGKPSAAPTGAGATPEPTATATTPDHAHPGPGGSPAHSHP